jgi:hypothetical protein
MDEEPKRFLRTWAVTCLLLATAIATYNVIVDPYILFGIPRISGFNARKPAVLTQDRLMKVYDVLRTKPDTIILGTSAVGIGLDAQGSAWPTPITPVYNLALLGSGPYSSYRYLQHVMARRHLDLVLMGLDFEFFRAVPDYFPEGADFEARLAVTVDGKANTLQLRQHARDLFQAALSLDALSDSTSTLSANLQDGAADLIAGNYPDTDFRRVTNRTDSFSVLATRDLLMIRRFRDKEANPDTIAQVRATLDLCESNGTRVILFINPVHADWLEILSQMGYWHEYESWKRDLLALTLERGGMHAGKRVPLWDFSGYDTYSTETAPIGQRSLHWFWDSTHYRRVLGDVMIGRMLETADTQFGTLLDPGNLAEHLAKIRERQRSYRESHPADERRVHDVYDSAVRLSTRIVAVPDRQDN